MADTNVLTSLSGIVCEVRREGWREVLREGKGRVVVLVLRELLLGLDGEPLWRCWERGASLFEVVRPVVVTEWLTQDSVVFVGGRSAGIRRGGAGG